MLHALLLRGVNVGGKNRLPMKDLAALVGEAGAGDVRTFIQSGNVVCAVDPARVEALRADVAAAIERRFGFRSPVVARSAAEWADLRAPWPDVEHVHVAFLADLPSPDRVARLDPARSPGDRFAVVGRDVYLHLPNGVARTRITNDWLDRGLATVSTARNWRTVRAIGEMLGVA
jgi:uncharacterized protein (DUF1697 family)